MVSSGMLRRVTFLRTDVSEELSASFIRVTRIGELETTLAVTSNRRSVRLLLVTASAVPSSPEVNDRKGSAALTTRHPSIHSWH
jgi:hypothetical protein